MINPDKIINAYIKKIPKSKWELINRTSEGVQIKQIKHLKMYGIWIGLILVPFWGIGFILWLLVLIDYVLQREKILFVSVNEMVKKLKAAHGS